MKRLSILIVLCLLWLPLSAAQRTCLFRQIDSRSSLPDNNVRNMLMLPNGLMCIQTSSMLSLYDGQASQNYPFNPIRIPYQEYAGMGYLCYDKQHALWFSNRDHTWRFDLEKRRFEYEAEAFLAPFDVGEVAIDSFFMLDDGDFWIITQDGKILQCNHEDGAVMQIDKPVGLNSPLIMAQQGSWIYMLSLDGTLARYDLGKRSFTLLLSGFVTSSTLSSRMDMTIASNGDVWMLYDREIIRYELHSGTVEHITVVPLGRNDVYTTFAMDANDRLWVGTAKSGVSILNTRTLKNENLPWIELTDGRRVDHNTDISKIYIDPNGGVWIATLTEGIFFWHKDIFRIQTVNNATLRGKQIPDESVKCIVEEPDGCLLLGTIKGLLRYDPKTGRLSTPWPALSRELCISLCRDSRNRIWLGTFHHGAYCIDGGRIRHYFNDKMPAVDVSYHEMTPNFNCVRAVHEDREGNFWMCVYGGLGRFDPESGEISLLRERHENLSRFMLTRGVCEVGDSLLVTSDNGRYFYHPKEDRVTFNESDPGQYISSNHAMIDSRGLLWIASSDGLHIRAGNGDIYRITTQDGLPNNNILGLAVDKLGDVWAMTFSHVSRIKPIRGNDGYMFAVTTFGADDGMSAGALFQNSVAVGSSGHIYVGGSHGFSIIDPTTLYQRTNNRPPMLSTLKIFDRTVEVGDEYDGRCILPVELSQMRHIDLRHNETFLTFGFSHLNYINPTHTVYRYKLENFDKEWTRVHDRGRGEVTYTLLSPGEYVFRVVAADNGTDWGDEYAELAITIHPPFYRTREALVAYIVIAILLAVLGVVLFRRRQRRRAADRRREEEQRQREELDQMKFRFFTNISHELRTPLSLILLPLESILRRADDALGAREQLQTIHSHVLHLLSLVNHLLDFRKLEMHGERLHLSYDDIACFVERQVDSFRDMAQEKDLDLTFDNGMKSSMMMFDPTQMYKIINNLLSNAMKFTPPGGEVSIRLSQPAPDCMHMEVEDTGIGIALEDRVRIFERFYQTGRSIQSDGSGIGLHLVKQYVEMHNGAITVESTVGVGSIFSIEIPMNLRPEEESESSDSSTSESRQNSGAGSRNDGAEGEHRTILMIDDNIDFRAYVARELGSEYEVIEASDGDEGVRRARKRRPHIIICDVMMPGTDGFEVCRKLKNDIETSHIPIILLTALMDDEVRRQGYDVGADAYISKPFNMEILRARIRNLIDERQKRINAMLTEADISPSKITVTPLDRQLLDKIVKFIERNIANANYSVEELASDAAMSRMSLYRKLHSITGKTPSEFLRMMRLKRAAQIIAQDRKLSVIEVSEMVGFGTPTYFTRYFREMYGCTPSQYYALHVEGKQQPAEEEESGE